MAELSNIMTIYKFCERLEREKSWLIFFNYDIAIVIGVALITQLRTCVIKIVTYKGGHLMCLK